MRPHIGGIGVPQAELAAGGAQGLQPQVPHRHHSAAVLLRVLLEGAGKLTSQGCQTFKTPIATVTRRRSSCRLVARSWLKLSDVSRDAQVL